MKDKKELLRLIMTALAKNNNDEADRLIHQFMSEISQITAADITQVAQALEDEKVFADAAHHLNIERKVFALIQEKTPKESFSDFPKGHPIDTFIAENRYIKNLCERAEALSRQPDSFNELYSDWALIAKQFLTLDIHYLRKENQLFPYLERYGFSHPSTIMWSIHDEIRGMAKAFAKAVNDKNEAQAKETLPKLIREAREMTVKEERVLFVRSKELLNEDDWVEIRHGEDEIGWLVPEPPKTWQAASTMDKHIAANPERIEAIMKIIDAFFSGDAISALQQQFNETLDGKVTPGEFALAEQKMKARGIDDSQFEERIDELLEIFKSSLEKVTIDNLEEGHPIHTFTQENEAIKALVAELRAKNDAINIKQVDHAYWTEAYEKLWQINTHYVRKENQLFPYLEHKGFDKPSTVMWALHDDVRRLIKYYRALLDDKNYEELFATQEMLFTAIEDMIFKEEKILWPTSLEMLTQEEWVEIRKGEDEVGYCLIEEPPMWNPTWKHPSEANVPDAMPQTGGKAAPKPFTGATKRASSVGIGGINLEVGSITPEQINLIFKHLPFDVTYVDEFDEVRYYNKGEDRVFPRSPGIIGRQVKFCHPPKSVYMVERIVDAFKKGERDEANFWIDFRGKFVYIQYFAVRDEMGNYRGVIEITYDGTTIRGLKGEQRLLDWE